MVASHLGLERVVPGAFGVTLFFFISGYLITRQLAAALQRSLHIGFAAFYWRRVLRLAPAGLAYVVIAGALYRLAGGTLTPGAWAAALFYGANYHELWFGYRSDLAGVRHPFNILWSLAIEEHFYLLWPAILAITWRLRRALPVVLALCAAVLLWRLSLLHMCFNPAAPPVCAPENPSAAWRYNRLYLATDTRLDSIAWGAALALLQARGRAPPIAAAWAGAALIAASFAGAGPLARHVLRPSLQGIGLLLLFPFLLSGRGGFATAILRSRPSLFAGRLSYSLYLWHWGALALADALAPRFSAGWVAIAVLLAGTLALASYYAIEQPMLLVRRRFGSHAVAALDAAAPRVLLERGADEGMKHAAD